MFAEWFPSDAVKLDDMLPLPPSIVRSEQVLLWGFEPEEDSKIPFQVLDMLMDQRHIDITGLRMSSTARGHLYRTHRLMR